MNEGLYTCADGLRLIQEYEGAPRLTARLCEGGAWELGPGVTFDLNGNPFKEGDTCTEEEALALFRNALEVFEDGVRKLVTIELTQHQFSALVAFSYNVGLENLANSTVLREVNASRHYNAADAFGMWVYATKNSYKQALRGLLRRRYAEACLYLSLNWTIACDIDAIALQRDKPATLPGRDIVRYKTPFKDVLSIAQRYPLATPNTPATLQSEPAELILTTPAPAALSVASGNGSAPAAPQAPAGASSPIEKPAVAVGPVTAGPVAAEIPAPQPKPQPAPVPAKVDAKPPEATALPPSVQVGTTSDMGPNVKSMYRSKRFWGGLLIVAGRLIIVVDVGGHFAPAVKSFIGDGVLMDWMTGIIVTMVGEMILDRGEKKAEAPMDTPKRIALMTPAP